jgi:hypothetical protein
MSGVIAASLKYSLAPAFGQLLQKVDQLNDEYQGERQVKSNFKVDHIDDLPDEG